MPTVLQLRRGTTAEHSTFTGAEGEVTVNTTKDTLVVHDGSTQGGFELALADGSNFAGDTDDVTEGSTNLYHTTARARSSVSASGDISYDSSTGVFSFTAGAADIEGVTAGSYLTGGGTSGTVTLNVDATDANTASKVVARDASGNFSAGTITAALTGNVTGNVTGDVTGDLTGTASNATTAVTLTGLTSTVAELNYSDGVTSNIQTQLDAKAPAANATLTGTTTYAALNDGTTTLTATAAELNTLDGITATVTELNYTDGVTSNIQTQLDAKAPIASPTFTGTATLPTVDINAGNIDGTTIGASSAAAGTFTTISTSGNATIGGNLTVSGTTTTVNSNEVNIGDAVILLNSDETGTPSQNAGIEVERGTSTNKTLVWNETSDKWTVGSDTFVAGTFEGNVTGDLTGDVTGNVTGNVTGSSGSTTGNAATATALQTARTIGGVSFDGTANINLPGVNTTGNQDTSGNAATASAWATARTLSLTGAVTGSASVDGSGNVSLTTTATSDPTLTLSGDASGSATFTNLGNATLTVTVADDSHNHITSNIDGLAEYISDTVGAMVTSNTETGITVTYNDIDNTLDFVVGTLNQDTTGNAATATALETARTIAGQSFDGTANISIAPTDLTGVTATAAEINKLDGVTATTTELNYVDGVTSNIQTQIDNNRINIYNSAGTLLN